MEIDWESFAHECQVGLENEFERRKRIRVYAKAITNNETIVFIPPRTDHDEFIKLSQKHGDKNEKPDKREWDSFGGTEEDINSEEYFTRIEGFGIIFTANRNEYIGKYAQHFRLAEAIIKTSGEIKNKKAMKAFVKLKRKEKC